MGMVFVAQTISNEHIENILNDPLLIWLFLSPDDSSLYVEEVRKSKTGFFAKLLGKKIDKNSIQIPSITYKIDENKSVDLDKAWHGIHYLLTHSEWEAEPPLNFITCGGNVVGNIEVGYGTARVLTSTDVQQINEAFKSIDHQYLKKRFNPHDMMKNKIYPEIWNRNAEDDDTLSYCIEYFDILKNFISETVTNKMGLLVYLT
ncbi:MAG: YfbM family protein [Desulfamplus sp.]|nr:YfbM family protein [Desulfamplus sp.]